MIKEETLRKTALLGICTALAVLLSWAALKYALPILLPFIIAYVLSLCVRPAALWLWKKTKIPEKIWAAFIIIAMSAAMTFALWKGVALLISEAGDAVNSLGEMLSDEQSPLSELLAKGSELLNKFTLGGGDFSQSVKEMISAALGRLSSAAAGFAGSFIAGAPSVLFAFAVGLISLFYFALDGEKIAGEAEKFLPRRVLTAAYAGVQKGMRALRRFFKAYLTIMAITFAELFVGFLIIGVKYAFLTALIISLVDMLPVLGVGTVLIPWAVILFLTGKGTVAVGLLVLLALMYAVRQFIEPKIVGNCAGVHPLLALVSVYAGFKLAGVGGMIVGPVILNALSVFWEERS